MPRPALTRWLFRLGLLLVLLLLAGLSFSLYVGHRLAAPAPRTLGAPPSGHPAETVHIPSPSGSDLAGWLSEVPDARGSIVLLHGVRADRRSMVGRAMFLSRESYHTPFLTLQFKPLLGIDVKSLSPLDAITHIQSPILLVNGSEDRHATAAEARALFRAANEPKELWIIEGASHVDLHRYAGDQYETKVRHFLDEHLQQR